MMRNLVLFVLCGCLFIGGSCVEPGRSKQKSGVEGAGVRLVTLDPGHYHAALVQKSMYEQVDRVVHVYAPEGPEVENHLAYIERFNSRADDPTSWVEKVYTGSDYLERMLTEKEGDVVVLSGNNRRKAEYIKAAVDVGFNVFCDKPMCINTADFKVLEDAFARAEKKGVLVYDIMTERFSIFHIVQKMLVLDKDVFGELQKGSAAEPAVVKQSLHHFFKYVSGTPIRRPTWYFDMAQQGEGLVDVTTHLIDLVMWTCFPNEAMDYRRDVVMKQARRQPTMITREQYEKATGAADFPGFLKGKLDNEGVLPCYANGEMIYSLKGVYVKLSVSWNFEAPERAGDAQYSLFSGTRARVLLKQGPEQGYRPQICVEPADGVSLEQLGAALKKAIARAQSKYPGLALERGEDHWQVVIPQEHQAGHEAHFREVTEKFLQYLAQGRLPRWEVPNMIAKYHITTAALELARQ
ncbi:MAG: Gfo/Idh/MocA family oxidoreductase [Sedimentisphaerales bacterium]|nr:Gfo/Idh/MocA family oxidoreductase [Sedimentisphaerales bacterium]